MLRTLLKRPTIRRSLGAGRKDDVGDIHDVPNTVIQVARYENLNAAVNLKLPTVEVQRKNARALFGALFVRRSRSPWVVIMTPEEFTTLLRWANYGVRMKRSKDTNGSH